MAPLTFNGIMTAPPSLHIAGLRTARFGPYGFDVPASRVTALVGPSGCGKSSLLRMIADLDPCEGEISLGDRNWRTMSAPTWRRAVALVSAEPVWWEPTLGAHMADRPVATALCAELGLDPVILDRAPGVASTGERQRLSLIRALVLRPAFLLLDEPTAALDDASARRVETLIKKTATDGTGVLLVSHSAGQVERLADIRLTMSENGLSARAA